MELSRIPENIIVWVCSGDGGGVMEVMTSEGQVALRKSFEFRGNEAKVTFGPSDSGDGLSLPTAHLTRIRVIRNRLSYEIPLSPSVVMGPADTLTIGFRRPQLRTVFVS
jgi:hypothetical protein